MAQEETAPDAISHMSGHFGLDWWDLFTYHCSGVYWAFGCLYETQCFRLSVALIFVSSYVFGSNYLLTCVIKSWQHISCHTTRNSGFMFVKFGCSSSFFNPVWRNPVSFCPDTASIDGSVSVEYRDRTFWCFSVCRIIDLYASVLSTYMEMVTEWPVLCADDRKWQVC